MSDSAVMRGTRVRKEYRRLGLPLSPRERELLLALATGTSQAEVAHGLGLSYQTVKNHLTSAYGKLGVGGLVEAFHALGWIRPEADEALVQELEHRLALLRDDVGEISTMLDRIADRRKVAAA